MSQWTAYLKWGFKNTNSRTLDFWTSSPSAVCLTYFQPFSAAPLYSAFKACEFFINISCACIFHCFMWHLKKRIIKIQAQALKSWLRNKARNWTNSVMCSVLGEWPSIPLTSTFPAFAEVTGGYIKGRVKGVWWHFLSGRQALPWLASVWCGVKKREIHLNYSADFHAYMKLAPHFMALTGGAPLKSMIPGEQEKKRQMRWCLAKGTFRGTHMQNVCTVCILSRAQWNPYGFPLVYMGGRWLLGSRGPLLVSPKLQLLMSSPQGNQCKQGSSFL